LTPLLQVVTAVYGTRHAPFLRVLLESLQRVGYRPKNLWVVTDAPETVPRGSAQAILLPDPTVGDNPPCPKSRKVVAWAAAADRLLDGPTVFLDADTLVQRPLAAAFSDRWEVGITVRLGRWPINSGVVFAHLASATRDWLGTWRDLTLWLEQGARAAHAQGTWGGLDQAALSASLDLHRLRVGHLPCARWNQGENPDDIAEPAVLHYKGLLPFLLGDKQLGPGDERDPVTFEPMRRLWLDHLETAR